MSITDRYATAIRSSSLKHTDERSKAVSNSIDDVDVLGAFGFANRSLTDGEVWSRGNLVPIPKAPLAVPLERLFMGDNYAAQEIVEKMVEWLRAKAPAMRLKMTTLQCADMAKSCLAWHRDHVCKCCGGQGMGTIMPRGWVNGAICKPCKGTGAIPFEKNFRHEHQELARWLVARMADEQCRAGPAAMRALAGSLSL